MEKEEPYFDEKGNQIHEHAVLKVFHFIGARKKKHYMYKWVKLKESGGLMRWCAHHLTSDKDSTYFLRSVANKETRIIKGTEIVQCLNEYRSE